MIQGMIERAMSRPTQRGDPEAQEAGQSWAMGRLDEAMQSAANPQRHATQEQQTRRKWMGNWVSTGQGEGEREPGMMFGNQPPRPQMPTMSQGQQQGLLNQAMDRIGAMQKSQGREAPSGFGVGGYFAGNSPSTALASNSLSGNIGSLYSQQAAKTSLAANNMTLHPGRNRSY